MSRFKAEKYVVAPARWDRHLLQWQIEDHQQLDDLRSLDPLIEQEEVGFLNKYLELADVALRDEVPRRHAPIFEMPKRPAEGAEMPKKPAEGGREKRGRKRAA